MTLRAKQGSNVAHVRLTFGKPRFWEFYTASMNGGTEWDGRRFRSRDEAIKAARAAGFVVRVDR